MYDDASKTDTAPKKEKDISNHITDMLGHYIYMISETLRRKIQRMLECQHAFNASGLQVSRDSR